MSLSLNYPSSEEADLSVYKPSGGRVSGLIDGHAHVDDPCRVLVRLAGLRPVLIAALTMLNAMASAAIRNGRRP